MERVMEKMEEKNNAESTQLSLITEAS